MPRLSLAPIALVLLAGCTGGDHGPRTAHAATVPPTTASTAGDGFVMRTVRDGGVDYRYQVFVPRAYDAERRLPVILFLHGSHAMGSDGQQQTLAGLGETVRARRDSFPAIVVFPQAPKLEHGVGRAIFARIAMRALDDATREFHGDSARTYLTGYSFGAKLGYELLAENPRRFAAYVPVSGEVCVVCLTDRTTGTNADSVFRAVIQRAGPVPMWLFHGRRDGSIPVASARRIVRIRQEMGAPVKYTELRDGTHDIWHEAYETPGLFAWLLEQHR